MNDLVAITAIDRHLLKYVAPVVESLGYELIRLRLSGGSVKTLQIFVDKIDSGVGVNDCASVSRAVSATLDNANPIKEKYSLEISSPGIDRPLTRLSHFEAWIGHDARIEITEPLDGQFRFRGQIVSVDNGKINISTNNIVTVIDFNQVRKAKLVMPDNLLRSSTPVISPKDNDHKI